MKICPNCNTQYTDDTLQFCLQDGTRLTGPSLAETPTVVLGETETVFAPSGQRVQVPISDPGPAVWPQSQVPHIATGGGGASGSNTTIIVVLAVIAVGAVLGLVGLGAWTFMKNAGGSITAANNANLSTPVTNSNNTAYPTATPTGATATPVSNIFTKPPVDEAEVRGEVSQKIYSWKSLTESKDMGGLRAAYAPTLDYYYTKRNVSAASVIDDKQRAFRDYGSIRITVSNISVTPDPSGATATAVFSKDWSFSGAKSFCGVIRSQMLLRKVDGVWLIAGERDVAGTFRRTC